jgi:PPM family protein phosphatase
MGGQLAAEQASQMAVELIPREVAKRIDPEADDKATQRAIRDAVAKANDEILALSHVGTDYAHMGTTVVLAHFQGGRVYVAGIGDSRAYRLRGDKLEQLTRDHSLANALGEAGTIKPEEVENHKFKHVLYLYLGSKDARDGPEEVRVLDAKAGDQFLLASDGLMGVVRDETIRDTLRAYDDPQAAAQALVDLALEMRSKDNITAVVIHVE